MAGKQSARDRILDAAQRIVLQKGAAHMTLDAVAAAAKMSKGGVIYHFASQYELLRALLERFMKRVEEHRRQIAAGLPDTPASRLKAYVLSSLSLGRETRRGAAALLATCTRQPPLVAKVRRRHCEVWREIFGGLRNPERAMIVALAVEGLWLSDLLGVSPLTSRARRRVKAILLRLADEWGVARQESKLGEKHRHKKET